MKDNKTILFLVTMILVQCAITIRIKNSDGIYVDDPDFISNFIIK